MTPKALTPVLFLHAFPLNGAMWEAQRQALAAQGRATLAPHFPGFGGRPPGEAALDAFARAAAGELDAFAQAAPQELDDHLQGADPERDAPGSSRAVVVGLSMGGYVALRFHALFPERVAALVLADTRAGADDEAGRAKRTDQAARARGEGVGWLPDALLPALLGETTRRERPEVVARVRRMMLEAGAEGVARALEAMRERPDSTPRLREVEVPVLALAGEEDTLTPVAEARRIAEGVPDGRLVVLPGAGHLSNLEDPDAFNGALAGFLESRGL